MLLIFLLLSRAYAHVVDLWSSGVDLCSRVGNYTVREVLMKNCTSVWRNVYNTASA